MLVRYLVLLCIFILLPDVVIGAENADPPSSKEFATALLHASETPGRPYRLQVNCTDQKGIRSLDLYPSGTTVWNRRSQITLPAIARAGLLNTLLEHGFAQFEQSYGGREHPEKSKAPTRISCQVRVEIESLEKSSVHHAGGEQTSKLTSLAAKLLDRGERYADNAVTPGDLQDAFAKLSNGQLAPETLRLRFVELPGRESTATGSILQIDGGEISRRAYTPGKTIAQPVLETASHEQFKELVSALQDAKFPDLPGNLWSQDHLELEIDVLAHKKVVLARSFSRLDPEALKPAQQRFDLLLPVLRGLAR